MTSAEEFEDFWENIFTFCFFVTFMAIIDVFFMLFISIFSLGRLYVSKKSNQKQCNIQMQA